ncbi:lipase family protein [Streptomyces sp. XY332]|uniref:lipase family protein n=1 Tax=Streptomyces sp. XY332 TaxID=1415561 RepID=UPI000A9E5111|nr:alpha/beta hydrolase [Streptomyces sp. XY332]
MTDAMTPVTGQEPEIASLHHLCRLLAEAAEGVGDASRYASELALGSRLPRTARGAAAWRTLLRTIIDPKGLGWAPRGRGLAGIGWLAGVFTSRESLAVSLAVTGLKARIRAAAVTHPELLGDPDTGRVLRAVEGDRQREAIRVFRSLLGNKGAERAFALLAPSFADILAWNALTDENPLNDAAGWEVATGRTLTGSEPVLGVSARVWALLDRGPGRAEPFVPSPRLAECLDTTGTIAGYVRNIDAVGTDGTLLVQQVVGPDGVQRYVVQLAGMAGVSDESPQDLLGAVHAVARPATPYSRAVAKALRQLIPSGCELALVGHSLGGITAMNLAADRDFCGIHQVTHVVAVGSPIDGKRPADPRTRVYSLVNEHDVVPSLEGRSSVSPYALPAQFTEFTWTDDTHAFPLCHAAERYAHNLEYEVPEASALVDADLAPFRGRVTDTRFFRLYDR